MRTTSTSAPSPRTSALKPQPTPQYAQVVSSARSGWPSPMIDFSVSAPVGQDSMHAPQETHSESRNGWSWLAATFEPGPAVPRFRVRLLRGVRSEEHTSELQSLAYLVC